jgi:hypothetical protein
MPSHSRLWNVACLKLGFASQAITCRRIRDLGIAQFQKGHRASRVGLECSPRPSPGEMVAPVDGEPQDKEPLGRRRSGAIGRAADIGSVNAIAQVLVATLGR